MNPCSTPFRVGTSTTQPIRRQGGYVLVLTIAALALLTMAGAYISQQISTAVRLAAAEQEFAEQERHSRDVVA